MAPTISCQNCLDVIDVPDNMRASAVTCGRCAMQEEGIRAPAPRLVFGRGMAQRQALVAQKNLVVARWTLLAVAVVLIGSAILTHVGLSEALAELRQAAARLGVNAAVRTDDGTERTLGEVLAAAEREAWIQRCLAFGLAATMTILWLWSLRKPRHAFAAALGIYLLLIGIAAIWDPSQIANGVLLKMFIILALLAGWSAARQVPTPNGSAAPARG